MQEGQELFTAEHDNFGAMLHIIRMKMFAANVVCCITGAAIMAATAHYLLMSIFIAILVCMCFTRPLVHYGKISPETACLMPMLLLCFVLTPASWFTFNGPMGFTPYLTLVFSALIIITYYQRLQTLLLTLYFTMIAAMTACWIILFGGSFRGGAIAGNVTGYALAAVLLTYFLLSLQRKNVEATRAMMDRSISDELTGLYNRRVMERVFDVEEGRYTKPGSDYAVMMLDIDRFKQLNDEMGHMHGDVVLKQLADCIKTSIRTADYAIRYGGDEFVVVLANAEAVSAQQVFGRIDVAAHTIAGYGALISLSMGFALRSECAKKDEMIALADRRMYESKSAKLIQ